MRIYVAGKWADKALIRSRMTQLEALGHTITYDWTTHKENKTQQTEYATEAAADYVGVTQAQLFIAFMDDPNYAYNGTFTEMGIALGRKTPVVIVTPHLVFNPKAVAFYRNCYTSLPLVRIVGTLEEALVN